MALAPRSQVIIPWTRVLPSREPTQDESRQQFRSLAASLWGSSDLVDYRGVLLSRFHEAARRIKHFNEDDIAILENAWAVTNARAAPMISLQKQDTAALSVETKKAILLEVDVLQHARHQHTRSLRSGKGWNLGEHEVSEVVSSAIASISTGLWTLQQRLAMQEWATWLAQWEGPSSGTQPIDHAIQIFSRFFFLGKLQNVTFEWRVGLRKGFDRLCPGVGTNGYALPTDNGVLIALDPEPSPARLDRGEDPRHTLLSTLLHECCHAMLHFYSCNKHGLKHECGHCGETGHGSAWFRLATKVEVTAREHLHFDARLRTLQNTLREYQRGNILPYKDWLWLNESFNPEQRIVILVQAHEEAGATAAFETLAGSSHDKQASAVIVRFWQETHAHMTEMACKLPALKSAPTLSEWHRILSQARST